METGQRLFDVSRARRLMQEAGIALVLASRRHNIAYLGGHFSVVYWEYPEVAHALEREDDGCQAPYYFVGLQRDNIENSFVIAHRTHIWQGRGWIQDVRAGCYQDESTHPVRQIVACIHERGLAAATIGVEMDHLPSGVLYSSRTRPATGTFCRCNSDNLEDAHGQDAAGIGATARSVSPRHAHL